MAAPFPEVNRRAAHHLAHGSSQEEGTGEDAGPRSRSSSRGRSAGSVSLYEDEYALVGVAPLRAPGLITVEGAASREGGLWKRVPEAETAAFM
jgi:hypothetical protein